TGQLYPVNPHAAARTLLKPRGFARTMNPGGRILARCIRAADLRQDRVHVRAEGRRQDEDGGTPVDGMVPAEEEARACNVSPGSSSLHSPEPAVLARCPRCPSCRTMRAAGACGAAKRATTYAWGKQPHTELNPAPAGDSATSAEPSTLVAKTWPDATAPARPECRPPS